MSAGFIIDDPHVADAAADAALRTASHSWWNAPIPRIVPAPLSDAEKATIATMDKIWAQVAVTTRVPPCIYISPSRGGKSLLASFIQEDQMKKYYRRKRRGYHFVGETLAHALQGVAVPADGKWLRMPPGSPKPRCCVRGFHASPTAMMAEQYRPHDTKWLCFVEVQHVTSNRRGDKFAGRARKIIARMPIERYDDIVRSASTWTVVGRRIAKEFKRIMREARRAR